MRHCIILLVLAGTGCQSYSERFTYVGPEAKTNHVVEVRYSSFLMWGKSARLSTETQTMEFLRRVNASGLEMGTDKAALSAIAEGAGAAAIGKVRP